MTDTIETLFADSIENVGSTVDADTTPSHGLDSDESVHHTLPSHNALHF